ncbi:hypothetical protein Goari_024088 [Gossypium aridum]|uniref:Protein kinase domain-containing protein n=1 Tax=Gossypium aridum TaxID=34290 RepID=A0A7J8X530_GOSAI|nr:hypothetical protein [Gossypium aridum]
MLRQGGFGSVYKGQLEDGRKVAIKRLSENSRQGEQEFKNEMMLLAKLQHRNLVRLLGFSFEQKERVLIYEFLPIQVLTALYSILEWQNCLRLSKVKRIQAKSLGPIKSDVYGFGVLVLEIISGQKINSFTNREVGDSLLTHAWRNWNEGTALEVVDPILRDGSRSEITRCIQLGLLCVQEDTAYRPTMASAVLMLSSYSISLPVPSAPPLSMHSIRERETKSKSSSFSNQSKRETIQVSVN